MPDYRLAKIPGSPRWYITWTEGHRSFRRTTGTADREQATQVLAAFVLEAARGPVVEPADVEVREVLETYYREHASKRPSAEQARIAKAHLIAFYGVARGTAVTAKSHSMYEEKRRLQGAGFQTINRERMVLRAAFNHSRRHHGLTVVPYVPTIPEDHPDNDPVEPKGRPLKLGEVTALLKACAYVHEWRFLQMLIGTLCRPDAAFDFEPDKQADFEHGLIDLSPPGRKQTKKFRPVVPMPRFLRDEFKRAGKGPFIAYHGEGIRSSKTAFRRMRADAGLDERVNPYSLRHTIARELRRRGVPGDQISIMLGHRPPNTKRTDLIYAPYEPGYCQDAKRAIESIWATVARNLRAPAGPAEILKPARKARRIMVGATGIEPVTPTMSRHRPRFQRS